MTELDTLGRPLQLKHGAARRGHCSPEYTAWKHMRARCANPQHPSFPDYGGRGIAVCPQWAKSFDRFLANVGRRPSPQHTLERLDNSRGYEPGNVAWATRKQQQRNTRRTVYLTFRGETRARTEWAELLGMKVATIEIRMRNGWSVERALSTPVGPWRGRPPHARAAKAGAP